MQLGDIWSRITEGEGYFHLCSTKDKYPVRIDHVIHYSDKSAVDDLRYALSYSRLNRIRKNTVLFWAVAGFPKKQPGPTTT